MTITDILTDKVLVKSVKTATIHAPDRRRGSVFNPRICWTRVKGLGREFGFGLLRKVTSEG